MATNPTRKQAQARDVLADLLNQASLAARLDGNPRLDSAALDDFAARVARLSSVYGLDDLVARALEKRALALGLSSGFAEMITLLETEITPLRMLWLDDEAFRAAAETMMEELGEM